MTEPPTKPPDDTAPPTVRAAVTLCPNMELARELLPVVAVIARLDDGRTAYASSISREHLDQVNVGDVVVGHLESAELVGGMTALFVRVTGVETPG